MRYKDRRHRIRSRLKSRCATIYTFRKGASESLLVAAHPFLICQHHDKDAVNAEITNIDAYQGKEADHNVLRLGVGVVT